MDRTNTATTPKRNTVVTAINIGKMTTMAAGATKQNMAEKMVIAAKPHHIGRPVVDIGVKQRALNEGVRLPQMVDTRFMRLIKVYFLHSKTQELSTF